MRSTVAGITMLMGLLLACSSGDDGVPDSTTPPADEALRIVDGPVQCDSCPETTFLIAGTGVEDVSAAAFTSRTAPLRILSGTTSMRRVAQGDRILREVTVRFSDYVPVGEYDLKLQIAPSGGPSVERVIAQALQVTRPWGPPPPRYGSLRILVRVSGQEPDTAFFARLNDGTAIAASPGAPATLRLRTGQYTVGLTDVEPNCSATNAMPWTPGGGGTTFVQADSTTDIVFDVVCAAYGYIRVAADISGSEPASDIRVTCDAGDCPNATLRFNGDAALLRVVAGAHDLSFQLPGNCSTSAAQPVTVQAVSGDTVRTSLALQCQSVTGTLRVTVRTTGPAPDVQHGLSYGYWGCEIFYDCEGISLPWGGTVSVRVLPGQSFVRLLGTPANCTIVGSDTAEFDVIVGATTDVTFDVACT